MAREPDADSRPISVAELMARARELDDSSSRDGGGTPPGRHGSSAAEASPTADAPPADTDAEGSGRRRRGGAGSVSFAELTGELPKLPDAGSRTPRQAPAEPSTEPVPADSQFVPTDPAPPRASFPRPFPRSDAPRATHEPEAFPRSEIPIGRPPEPPTPQAPWSSPDRSTQWAPDRPSPGRSVPPPTRDISSGAIQDRFRASPSPAGDDAVETGIIPRVDVERAVEESAPSTGSLDAADLSHLSRAEREREFERYRNFEDIDGPVAPGPDPKKKRGLLGGLRRGKQQSPEVDHDAVRADRDRQPRGDDGADDNPQQWDSEPWSRWPADDTVETDPAGQYGASVRDVRDHLRDSSDFDFADDRLGVRHPDFGLADDDRAENDIAGASTGFENDEPFPRDTAATQAVPVPGGRRRRDEEAETQIVDLDRAQSYSDPAPDYRPPRADEESARTRETSGDTDSPRSRRRALKAAAAAAAADTSDTEQSPARQWAMLGVQVAVGLVVGVGLFLGFHELWKWNVYFALILAVVVMFGMVTTVHVVRRSQDLISTLLALGVGLIVTIGPLVLLASGS